MPWEEPERGFGDRLFSTLSATFSPVRTVHAAAMGPLAPAIKFALLTMLPCMLFSGIIPFTRTLAFGAFDVVVKEGTDQAALMLDISRAGGLSFCLSAVRWLAWTLPFVSLTAAFAPPPNTGSPARVAAWRSALYRGWVIPAGFLLFNLTLWLYPPALGETLLIVIALVCQLVPRMLVIIHCQMLARYLGASYFGALGVALVPLAFEWAVLALTMNYAQGLLPEIPAPP